MKTKLNTLIRVNRSTSRIPAWIFFILLANLFFNCSSVNAQSNTNSELTEERAKRALETSDKAYEKALEAEKIAIEAQSSSQLATQLSNERFVSIRDLLYILSIVMGVFLIITSLYEFNRRKIEQARYDEFMQRQKQFDAIQIELGKKSVESFDESFKSQVDSISKLGSIIALVEKTFENQSKASEDIVDLSNQVANFNKIFEKQKNFNILQFNHLYNDLLPFTKMSRMEWTWITHEEQIHIERALSRFETLDELILNDMESPERIPHTCYLLGIGAFYRNDVITAINYLKKAIKKYDELGGFNSLKNTEYHFPYIFSHHFLGIIEKNWWDNTIPLDVNTQKAKEYLNKAKILLEGREGELLTPVTYAEVLSYIEAERQSARDELDRCLKELQKLKKRDSNQNSLESRIYLYYGNLDYLDNKFENAYKFYEQAIKSNINNYYAWFSKGILAQKLKIDSYSDDFKKGLEFLHKSSALSKPEITIHVTLLAWASIASSQIHDRYEDDYKIKFETAINRIHRVGSRIPLFFGPVSKHLLKHEELLREVGEHVNT